MFWARFQFLPIHPLSLQETTMPARLNQPFPDQTAGATTFEVKIYTVSPQPTHDGSLHRHETVLVYQTLVTTPNRSEAIDTALTDFVGDQIVEAAVRRKKRALSAAELEALVLEIQKAVINAATEYRDRGLLLSCHALPIRQDEIAALLPRRLFAPPR
jgi:hypothetical protein